MFCFFQQNTSKCTSGSSWINLQIYLTSNWSFRFFFSAPVWWATLPSRRLSSHFRSSPPSHYNIYRSFYTFFPPCVSHRCPLPRWGRGQSSEHFTPSAYLRGFLHIIVPFSYIALISFYSHIRPRIDFLLGIDVKILFSANRRLVLNGE